MSTIEQTSVYERVVISHDADLISDVLQPWRDAINSKLEPEFVRGTLATDAGTRDESAYHLPDHELSLDVVAPFVPFTVRGAMKVGEQLIPWIALLDLDDSKTEPDWIRKQICVFSVTQE